MNIQSSHMGLRRKIILSLSAVILLVVVIFGALVYTKTIALMNSPGGCVQSFHRDSSVRAYSCS